MGVKILYNNKLTRPWCLSRQSPYSGIKYVKVFHLLCSSERNAFLSNVVPIEFLGRKGGVGVGVG